MSASKVQPILTAENVTMRFGGVTAVSDLSLKVDEGSIVGVIGPNGAGKTTLFNVLSGFYTPQEGDVRFAGKSIRPTSSRRWAWPAPSRTSVFRRT